MVPEFLIAGHITRDRIEGRTQPGGSALYGSAVARGLGYQTALWTGSSSPTFVHELDRVHGKRTLYLETVAEPLDPRTIEADWRKCPRVMISPVWQELGPEALAWFETGFVGLTPQGWFRARDATNRVFFRASRWRELPRKAALIVVSVDDIAGDPEAWDWIRVNSRVAVKTMGKNGHLVATEEGEMLLKCPYVAEEVDPTGAGDAFATAMLIGLSEGLAPEDAAAFASAAASFIVEKPGTDGAPTREDLLARLRGHNCRP